MNRIINSTSIAEFFEKKNFIADDFELWLGDAGVHASGYIVYGPAHDFSNLPEGWKVYGLRHADDDDMCVSTLEKSVLVNCYGQFVTKTDLDDLIAKDGYVDVMDWNYID